MPRTDASMPDYRAEYLQQRRLGRRDASSVSAARGTGQEYASFIAISHVAAHRPFEITVLRARRDDEACRFFDAMLAADSIKISPASGRCR